MSPFAAVVMPTHTGTEALVILLRWVHFLAGITWIGLLYFFNLVNVPFMKSVDTSMKPKIFENMTMPAMQLISLECHDHGVRGFLVLGPDSGRARCSADGSWCRQHHRTIPVDLDCRLHAAVRGDLRRLPAAMWWASL